MRERPSFTSVCPNLVFALNRGRFSTGRAFIPLRADPKMLCHGEWPNLQLRVTRDTLTLSNHRSVTTNCLHPELTETSVQSVQGPHAARAYVANPDTCACSLFSILDKLEYYTCIYRCYKHYISALNANYAKIFTYLNI